jgi:hypothetical protein
MRLRFDTMRVLKLLGVWLFVVAIAVATGFFVGTSPVGDAVLHALGGEGYDGWQRTLTGVIGGIVGFVGGAVLATLAVVRMTRTR